VKHVLALVCCISLFSLPGLAQKKAPKEAAMSDQQFVDFAGQIDMVDAHLGQLADVATPSQPVKDYAKEVVNDETKDYQQLTAVAHQASLSVPSAIDGEHIKTTIDPFEKLKGTPFDHRFVKEMIEGESKAVDIYKKEVSEGRNLDLRGYAEKALPALETHLADAKKLEKAGPQKKG